LLQAAECERRDAIAKTASEALLQPIDVKVRAAGSQRGAPVKVVTPGVSDPKQPFRHVMRDALVLGATLPP
jgi:hypothetical protein